MVHVINGDLFVFFYSVFPQVVNQVLLFSAEEKIHHSSTDQEFAQIER